VKLTEAKLKQMIVEALKKKYDGTRFVDFGIPTPDEALRSKLGDENFDKIQSLDKNQADVMKQTFDPNYPRDVKYETIQSFMESHGYDLEIQEVEYIGRPDDIFMNELYLPDDTSKVFSIDYGIKTFDSLPNKKYIYYNYSYTDNRGTTRKNGSIELRDMFDLDMGSYYDPNEEDIETMSTYIILRIKNDLEKILDK
tara:strand:+ start:713 stop:1303 length:591 start_codon:yes stop_codon:yes gene_type:complete